MTNERISFSEEQLSDLMKRQRLQGAERAFKYIIASSILAAIVIGLASSLIDAGQAAIVTVIILNSATAFAVVTSN